MKPEVNEATNSQSDEWYTRNMESPIAEIPDFSDNTSLPTLEFFSPRKSAILSKHLKAKNRLCQTARSIKTQIFASEGLNAGKRSPRVSPIGLKQKFKKSRMSRTSSSKNYNSFLPVERKTFTASTSSTNK